MTAQKAGRSKSRKAGDGRGSSPIGPARRPRRQGRDVRNPIADLGAIRPQELKRLSEEPLFIDGLKQVAQIHMGGMPDHLVKLAARLGADLAMTYESMGARGKKKSARSKKR